MKCNSINLMMGIFVATIICMAGCGGASGIKLSEREGDSVQSGIPLIPALIKTGAAINIVDKYRNNPLWNLEGNGTFLQEGGEVRFYFSDQHNRSGQLRTASDINTAIWSAATTVITANGSWFTVCKDPETGIIYALGTSSPGNSGNVYAFKSIDGLIFTAINNGNPVLSQPTDINSVWFHRWNLKLVIENGIFHLWMDTAYALGPIGGPVGSLGIALNWGQAYSHATLGEFDTLNFETNKSKTWAIPQGNALEAIYVSERKAVFFLDAHFPSPTQLDGHNGLYSHLVAWAIPTGVNFADPTKYVKLNFLIEGQWSPDAINRRSISDPGIGNLASKTSGSVFSYNYDQQNQNVEYSDMTILQMYDAAGGLDYTD